MSRVATVMTNKELDEYSEYREMFLSGNRGLYDWADERQLSLLKKYMRVRSRAVYHRLTRGAHRTLQVAPDKAAKLAELSQYNQDWEYTGMVDTGYLGAGHCALGHALRYEHYATSISTGSEIIFGSKCVSDFFNIPQSVLNSLVKVQQDVIDELKIIPYVLDKYGYDRWVANKYPDFTALIQKYGEDKARSAFGGYYECMVEFVKNRIPFTKYMVGVYANARYDTYAKIEYEEQRFERAKQMTGGNKALAEKLSGLEDYRTVHFVKLVIALFSDGYSGMRDAPITDDEKNTLIEYAVRVGKLSEAIRAFGRKNGRYDIKGVGALIKEFALRCRQECFVVKTKDYKSDARNTKIKYGDPGIRLATKGEVARLSKNLLVSEMFPLGHGEFQAACLIAWCISGDTYVYGKIGVYGNGDNEEMDKMLECLGNLKNSLNWAEKGSYIELLEKVPFIKGVEYLETAHDEDTSGKPVRIPDMVEYISFNSRVSGVKKLDRRKQETIKIGLDIGNKWDSYKKDLTLRQQLMLKSAYDFVREATGDIIYDSETSDDKKYGADNEYYGGGFGGVGQGRNNPLLGGASGREDGGYDPSNINDTTLFKMAETVVAYADKLRYKTVKGRKDYYKFNIDVCSTVSYKRACSEKQKKFVIEAYDKLYEILLNSGDEAVSDIPVSVKKLQEEVSQASAQELDDYSGIAGGQKANIMDVDNPEGTEQSVDTTQVIDLEALKKKRGIPTVMEISVALGGGMFKVDDIKQVQQ